MDFFNQININKILRIYVQLENYFKFAQMEDFWVC